MALVIYVLVVEFTITNIYYYYIDTSAEKGV